MKLEEKFDLIDVPPVLSSLSVVRAELWIDREQVLIGKDGQGNLHFLVRDPESRANKAIIERLPEGLAISWRFLEDNLITGSSQNYFDFSCANRIDLTLFCAIIEELISKVTVIDQLSPALTRIIEEWGALLAFPKFKRLTAEGEIGLFGELWILKSLLAHRQGSKIEVWTGPLGSRHDFELAECSLEVKTNLLRSQHVVAIHGERQLEPTGGKDLYLIALRVEPDSSGISVFDLRKILISLLDYDQRRFLEQIFLQMGLDFAAKDWEPVHFHVHSVKAFLVDSSFPKVVRRDLDLISGGSNIMKIAYDVLLDNLGPVSHLRNPTIDGVFPFWEVTQS